METKGNKYRIVLILLLQLIIFTSALAQYSQQTYWSADGNKTLEVKNGNIIEINALNNAEETILVSSQNLKPKNQGVLNIARFAFSTDKQKVLLNTNTQKVWRYDTRGNYWVYNLATKTLTQIGEKMPDASLMFAKFSPDGSQVAFVSQNNIYVQNLENNQTKALTTDGSLRLINGTFDWVYEEEFDCRDGFRWSPDGKNIAYWQIDARTIKNYLMINNTDSLYPFTTPVEYPVVGQNPSNCKIGVVNLATAKTKWMNVPGSAVQNYIPRMEWANNNNELILQQLNRRQNQCKIMLVNTTSAQAKTIYQETDSAWVDAKSEATGWEFINGGSEFIWQSEKDGWRHVYAINREGKQRLITKGNYDVISVVAINEATGLLYFMASPNNAIQSYLYKISLTGDAEAERITPYDQPGTHSYDISPNGKLAFYSFSNASTYPIASVVALPNHQLISGGTKSAKARTLPFTPEFFRVTTADGVSMDGWMVKPDNFDATKKYPVLFYVYGEPASQTVKDVFGIGYNRLYAGNMAKDGYIYISVDGRGSPAPKGRNWRKAIYHNIGNINIRDQAMAAKEIFKWGYIDTTRVAVWGWSGGGSSTLNLLFQYPDVYQTGISIAAVDNQLNYDNIYQERYMGLLPDDKHYFVDNSPLAHAKNLKGNLLLIHGTGDDNVHFNNAEQMINELIKHNKPFQLMTYPNRSHSINEGEGTSKHLATIFTKFLKENCTAGGR
ncbi:MAG: S9 family peptidase [Sphingobacteriales bacterium]|nr:MAG: S9 family peptidase [Sphingobacteriales bacterium]TAF83910.1 MAG: S9 family peptidase [Sphingobacteriales bacterium]